MALRNAEPSRRRYCGCRGHDEPRTEERQGRRIQSRREAPGGGPRQAYLQGTASVCTATRVLAHPHDSCYRYGANSIAHQELVPFSWHPGCGCERLWCSTPKRVDEAASYEQSAQSNQTLRSSRLRTGTEEASRGRSRSRSQEAPDRQNPGDRTWLRSDSRSPTGSDGCDATSIPNEASVLELLRAWHCDPLEFGLGPDIRWEVDQGSSAADARSIAPVQSLFEGHLQGELWPIRP